MLVMLLIVLFLLWDRQEDGEADAAMKEADLELISIFKLDDIVDAKNE